MLVLTREQGKSVIIGNREVVVTVLEVRRGKVTLGFEAKDPNLLIHREEVFLRIEKGEPRV